jgi:hypothetical protein
MGACREKLAIRFGPTNPAVLAFAHVCNVMDSISMLLSKYREATEFELLASEIDREKV